MAKVIAATPRRTGPGRPRDRKIDRWLNGRRWQLTHGVDFFCRSSPYAASLRKAAETRGIVAEVFAQGPYVYIKARKQVV